MTHKSRLCTFFQMIELFSRGRKALASLAFPILCWYKKTMMNNPRPIDSSIFLHSPAGRQWQSIGIKDHHGLVIPLFSLHSSKSCGIGEYTDLFPMIDWCQSIGFDLIQFLPMNDTGPGTSPYSALSAFALHPIYLGLASLPYLEQYPDLTEEVKELQKNSKELRINYSRTWENKKRFLRQYYSYADTQIISSHSYKEFIDQSHWLKGYAIFKTLKNHYQWKSWEDWPPEHQNPTQLLLDHLSEQFHDEIEFHCVLQFLCDQQLRAVKAHAEAHQVLLMGDIPILTGRDSADVWLHRELFDLNYSAGAPPDYFSPEGQNWGFPLYNWERIHQLGFKWWIDRLKNASHYYHIYRIDHIVGFFRIWAIPQGLSSKEGLFIPKDESVWVEHGRQIMWMMLEQCDMLPIGEDLGVVPREVRSCLSTLGICGTRVMRWERKWLENQQYIPFAEYQVDSMTTVSTHDSEPLQLWWRDQPEEAKLFADYMGWPYQTKLSLDQQQQILRESHRTNSLFHINLLQEYLSLIPEFNWPNIEDDRINVPGTISDRNWTYRFLPSVEEITQNQTLKSFMHELISHHE